jgi:hypothetical protein
MKHRTPRDPVMAVAYRYRGCTQFKIAVPYRDSCDQEPRPRGMSTIVYAGAHHTAWLWDGVGG